MFNTMDVVPFSTSLSMVHSLSHTVWRCACLLTWLHVCLSDANKVKIGACGGIERIVIAMKGHPTSVDVQQYGCGALANLARNGT